MDEPLIEMHCIVMGVVQGVSFRATTRQHAIRLGIQGTVKNLADGSVEIYAQGSKARLEELLSALKNESLPIRVDSYLTEFYPPKQKYYSFSLNF